MEIDEEAIVLKSIDFRDHEKMLILLSARHGVISAIVKHLSPKDLLKHSLCSPLSRGLYHLKRKTSEVFQIVHGSLIDPHLELRSQYLPLKSALEMLQITLRSQMPGKTVPALYQLLIVYLKELKKTPYPRALLMSFYLKLLKHEGVYPVDLISDHHHWLGELKDFSMIQEEVSERESLEIKQLIESILFN